MSKVCELTGVSTLAGKTIQHHSTIGWRYRAPKKPRVFDPNIRKIKINRANGSIKTIRVSMKAYKRLRKDGYFVGKYGDFKGERVTLYVPQKKAVGASK